MLNTDDFGRSSECYHVEPWSGQACPLLLWGPGYRLWPNLSQYSEEVDRQRRLLSANLKPEDLVRMAALAANGHNTQPWRFRLDDTKVTILPDFQRRTEIVAPDDHHLFVSLGCAAENLKIAAMAHGWFAEPAFESVPEAK